MLATARTAHVISADDSRFRAAEVELRRAGFANVRRVRPIAVSDKRVIDLQRSFGKHPEKVKPGEPGPRRVISIMLTHEHLWHRSASGSRWKWIFEDDARFNHGLTRPPRGAASHPSIGPADARPQQARPPLPSWRPQPPGVTPLML